jgi:thioredoxin 1
MAEESWTIRVRLPILSTPASFTVNPTDPVSVLETLIASDPNVSAGAKYGVSLMCGIPPKILSSDAQIKSVLKNNEIAIARIRGASDVVSRADPGASMLPASDGKVIEIGTVAALKQLLGSKPKVVIDFYADWCGPCKAIAPEIVKMAQTMRGVIFAKVDVDASQELSEMYKIRAMPTIVFHSNGREVKRIEGADMRAIEAAAKAL